MSTINATNSEWEARKTNETRNVENILRKHFESVDAYRYNSASVRVRIIDPKFKGLSREERDDLVEPTLDLLPEDTQADIINLVLLYPGEEHDSFRANMMKLDFEHPLESML
jgi:stress-induced morphogen